MEIGRHSMIGLQTQNAAAFEFKFQMAFFGKSRLLRSR
jgi:hypothetical protein